MCLLNYNIIHLPGSHIILYLFHTLFTPRVGQEVVESDPPRKEKLCQILTLANDNNNEGTLGINKCLVDVMQCLFPNPSSHPLQKRCTRDLHINLQTYTLQSIRSKCLTFLISQLASVQYELLLSLPFPKHHPYPLPSTQSAIHVHSMMRGWFDSITLGRVEASPPLPFDCTWFGCCCCCCECMWCCM